MQQMEITRPWIILNCKNNAMSKKLETHTNITTNATHYLYSVYCIRSETCKMKKCHLRATLEFHVPNRSTKLHSKSSTQT